MEERVQRSINVGLTMQMVELTCAAFVIVLQPQAPLTAAEFVCVNVFFMLYVFVFVYVILYLCMFECI